VVNEYAIDGSYHITPGSGNHYSDEFRGAYGDYFLMSGSDFNVKYGLPNGADVRIKNGQVGYYVKSTGWSGFEVYDKYGDITQMMSLTLVNTFVEVGQNGGKVDPYNFYFFGQDREEEAYNFMLNQQKLWKKELMAYGVRDENGKKGVLVVPWFENGEDYSHPYVDKYGGVTNYTNPKQDIYYDVLFEIHTHPGFIYRPSVEDFEIAKKYLQMNISHFILGDHAYMKTEVYKTRSEQEIINNYYLLNGEVSLF